MHRQIGKRKTRAIRESVAYMMRHNLRGVVRQGTATQAKKLSHMVAGKTGSLPYDIWFNGMTSHLVTTVWVGADRRERILGRSKSNAGVYGAGPPLSTFMRVTSLALEGVESRDFLREIPASIDMIAVDPVTGSRALSGGVRLPHRRSIVPLNVHKGAGSTDDIHQSETDF